MTRISVSSTVLVLCGMVFLWVQPTAVSATVPTACKSQHAQTVVLEQSHERTLVQISTNEAVEMLVGQLAREYVAGFSPEKVGRLYGPSSELERRGFQPTDLTVVLRSMTRDPRTGAWVGGAVSGRIAPTTSGASSEGEIVLVSWDDGDDTTWEGTTYAENYSTGSWRSWESQADISGSQGFTIWEITTGGGGGGGDPEDPGPLVEFPMLDNQHRPQLASLTPEHALQHSGASFFTPVQEGASWSEFLMCSLAGCYSCYKVCRLTGPMFWFCMDPCCMTIMLSCLVLQVV